LFSNDPDGRILAIIEGLRVQNTKLNNIMENKIKILSWKEPALNAAFEMIK